MSESTVNKRNFAESRVSQGSEIERQRKRGNGGRERVRIMERAEIGDRTGRKVKKEEVANKESRRGQGTGEGRTSNEKPLSKPRSRSSHIFIE